MGQTLTNGIYLPSEGERNCYSGLAANWNAVDTLKGNYSLHAINVEIHVTAAEKEAWNGKADASALTAHTGDTTIHVTAEDKAAWNGKADASALTAHTGDTTIHVTAEDKAKWDAVTGKADDADVVHKSGDESVIGSKRFGVVQNFTGYPAIRLYSANDDINVLPSSAQQRDIRFTDKNNAIIAYFIFQHRTDSNEPFRTCWRQNKLDGTPSYYSVDFNNLGEFYPENDTGIKLGTSTKRWSGVYATNYYYGSNNVEFSTKFVTTDTAQTISGSKTFSSINGVEPSSLSLPSGNRSDVIDISSYLSKLDGTDNTYVAPVNGWITIKASTATSISCTISNLWNDSRIRTSAGGLRMLFPVLKGQTVYIAIYATTLDMARFIPCQGNI